MLINATTMWSLLITSSKGLLITTEVHIMSWCNLSGWRANFVSEFLSEREIAASGIKLYGEWRCVCVCVHQMPAANWMAQNVESVASARLWQRKASATADPTPPWWESPRLLLPWTLKVWWNESTHTHTHLIKGFSCVKVRPKEIISKLFPSLAHVVLKIFRRSSTLRR